MSGLKINFSKSELVMINGDDMLEKQFSELFNCQIGHFPIKYLGVPVSPSKLHVADWAHLIERNGKKLDTWKGSSMSIAGRTTLINSSLSSTFIYHMSLYRFQNLWCMSWINNEELSSAKVGELRGSITLLDGVLFAKVNKWEALVLKILQK